MKKARLMLLLSHGKDFLTPFLWLPVQFIIDTET